MKTRVMFAFLFLLAMTLIATYNSCGITKGFGTLNGTSTGNPGNGGTTGNPAITHPGVSSMQILNAICDKLTECHEGAINSDCTQTLTLNLDASPLVNSSSGQNILFNSLEQEEMNGVIFADFGAVDTCLGYITKLTCQDSRVAGAYNSNSTQPYGGAGEILSPAENQACSGIYRGN